MFFSHINVYVIMYAELKFEIRSRSWHSGDVNLMVFVWIGANGQFIPSSTVAFQRTTSRHRLNNRSPSAIQLYIEPAPLSSRVETKNKPRAK